MLGPDLFLLMTYSSPLFSASFQALRVLNTLGTSSADCYEKDNICDLLFAFLHNIPLLKRDLL